MSRQSSINDHSGQRVIENLTIVRDQTLGEKELQFLLRDLDRDSQPPLSSRVSLLAYARKLRSCAILLVARQGFNLVGLAAVYCNDRRSRLGFLTYIGVRPETRGFGIGKQLLLSAIRCAEGEGMRELRLEVSPDRPGVQEFYERTGFRICRELKPIGYTSGLILRLPLPAAS